MAQYMITYLGGDQPSTQEAGKQHFSEYRQWLSHLGDAVVSPANPLKGTMVVNPDGSIEQGSKTSMSGYTIVEASTIELALEMAKTCPFLSINGTLEVSELIKMSI
jgi:hypothetical protein